MKLTIGHLFPDLLNLYGDRGNIITLKNRLLWRGYNAQVMEFSITDDIDFSQLDIVFIGGGSDREQLLVCKRLIELKEDIYTYAHSNGPLVAVCGGYQLLGHYYKLNGENIEGLSLLDIYTEWEPGRLIGNVVIESELLNNTVSVVGFENHGGRTYINNHTPLGKVRCGFGNNGKDGGEGVIYKNVIGTYLHGPLLPKNPALADYIIERAFERRFGSIELQPLEDLAENTAHARIIERYLK